MIGAIVRWFADFDAKTAAPESVRRKAGGAFTRLTATLHRAIARIPRPLA
jgi:hypothetical protein